ncbi:zinc-binding dehydrogenase [Streptomyces sp. NPDC058755]|uniref:zinc-binding dehydrogenase n=1 Tax=unclassified Streptomyces TaxID=2593676 RepID=UPI00369D7478
MRASVIHGHRDVRVEEVPDPRLRYPTDALVRVTHACVCGSDLLGYRNPAPRPRSQRTGHEFIGVVEAVGSAVTTLREGDRVIAPFTWSDGVCAHCAAGLHTSCVHGGFFGQPGSDGAHGEAVRVPFADGTLVTVPADAEAPPTALLALCDVMGTGHHAALCARVRPGATVAVVGDGAVGLCGVLAARRLGAERVIALSSHPDRAAVARRFGASDIVAERGEGAVESVRELTRGLGAEAVLGAAGTGEALHTALGIVRDGGAVGFVGVPRDGNEGLDFRQMFRRNVALSGGVAPVRAHIPELLADVLAGRLDPSPVFDLTVKLDGVPEGFRAMNERRAIKTLIEL